MKRIFLGLAILLAPFSANARPADCLFVIDGKTIADGPCDFKLESTISYGKGSFVATFANGYFALVYLTSLREAKAHWNEEPWVSHAHTDLGKLTLKGACWQNQTTKLCVLNPSKRSLASRASPKQLVGTVADKYCQIGASKNIEEKLDKKVYRNCMARMANTVRKKH